MALHCIQALYKKMKKIRFASIYLLTLAIVFFAIGVCIEVHLFYSNESFKFITKQPIHFIKFLHLIFFLLGFLIITTIYLIEKRESKILSLANLTQQKEIVERKRVEKQREKLIYELRKALNKVKLLSGLLPICASCKKIRDDQGYWNQIEVYIRDHSEADFSHSICPECSKDLYSDLDSYLPTEEQAST